MPGTHDPRLVVLSIAVAVMASYTALDLAGRITGRHGRAAWAWLIGGAVAMGTGIWSMHFIAMLSFTLQTTVAYDVWINAASWLIGVFASGAALVVVRRPVMTTGNLARGATVMGLGIATMHYTGMSAMMVSPPIAYDGPLVVASIVVAIAASLAALWLAFRLRQRYSVVAVLAKVGSALVMGFAIAGMHYTGMAAAHFAPDTVSLAAHSLTGLDDTMLAALIAVATLGLMGVTLVISAFDAYRAARTEALAYSLQATNQQLRAAALHDTLTGLPNRVLLEERLVQAERRAQRSQKPFAVMYVDLDRFKPVNDMFGHQVGDLILKAVAQRLEMCLRREDTVARMGGDEFVVVLTELARAQDAALVGEKILKELARPIPVEQHRVEIGCSIGISVFPDDAHDGKTLMGHADVAMYHAKQNGRNQYSFFAPGMSPGAAQ